MTSLDHSPRVPGQVFLTLLLLLVGCAVRQPPETTLPPQVETPDTWAAAKDAAPEEVSTGWLDDFQDPRLEGVVAEALENNQDLQTAAAQLEVARQAAIRAGAGMYPFVSLGAGGSSSGDFEGGDSRSSSGVSLDVSWEVDLWGRIRAGKASAASDFQAAQADYAFARLSLAAQTAKAWFLAIENRLQVELSQQNVELYERAVSLVQARYNAGIVSELDLHLAKFQLASGERALRDNRASFEQAMRSLEVLLGRYPDAEMALVDDLATVPPPIPAGIPAEILERRPDLVAAERQVAAAFYTIQVAQAARLPSLSLTGSAGTASSDLRDVLNLPNAFWSLGAGLFAPLFAGGELKANVEAANAQQQAALHRYVQVVLGAFGEVENTLANEEYLEQSEGFIRAAVLEAEGAVRQAVIQYEFGVIAYANVITIQDRYVAAQRQLVAVRNSRLANRINLYLGLGVDYATGAGQTAIASTGPDEE